MIFFIFDKEGVNDLGFLKEWVGLILIKSDRSKAIKKSLSKSEKDKKVTPYPKIVILKKWTRDQSDQKVKREGLYRKSTTNIFKKSTLVLIKVSV